MDDEQTLFVSTSEQKKKKEKKGPFGTVGSVLRGVLKPGLALLLHRGLGNEGRVDQTVQLNVGLAQRLVRAPNLDISFGVLF